MTLDGHTIHVVPWSQTHVPWLTYAIGAFLETGLTQGGDMLATPRNIETYLTLGLRGAETGDPCLLAVIDEMPVSYIEWIEFPPVADTKWKSINAIGSYTAPQWRNRTISKKLHEVAFTISQTKGYERVTGLVFNTNTLGFRELCVNRGWWPMSTNIELRVP